MRTKKTVEGTGEIVQVVEVTIPTKIDKVAIDYGREDINTLAIRLINEVIEKLNTI